MKIIADNWSKFYLQKTPFVWGLASPGTLICNRDAQCLAGSFPTHGMVRLDEGSRLSSKSYRNFSLPIEPEKNLEQLPVIWRHFLTDLRSTTYKERVASFLRQSVAERVTVRLVRHAPDDWMSPHTDSPQKLFTQTFYFNEDWQAGFGGGLEILERNDMTTMVAASVLPTCGTSVILCPSPTSWHQVVKVSATATSHRLSVVVHGES